MKGKFFQNDEAVSPIIGAILILAIGVTVLTNVQINFVPVWNAQEELNHLEQMSNDFKELKSSIESSAISGTALSSSLSMGFKYSSKIIAYNPRESAYAVLSIQNDTWAEVRYNEELSGSIDDDTSVKNISTSTITYSLQGTQDLSSFIYEHGLIRRGGSDYTRSSQNLVSNDTIYLLGVGAAEPEANRGVEKRIINIYPVSQPKNLVIGKNVWLILRTRYIDWWIDQNNPSSIPNQGGVIKKIDNKSGTIYAYFDRMAIRMGETQVTTLSKKPPDRPAAKRLVRVTPQNVNLPIDGISSLAVEVRDIYNNPVPNVQVNFSINTDGAPGNAYQTATLLQNSAISGSDGRASVLLRTSGAGIYYINATVADLPSAATFSYPATSQGGFILLSYVESAPDYIITATLKNGFGEDLPNEWISFETGEGILSPLTQQTDLSGNASTALSVASATGIEIKNILISSVSVNSATIAWDTRNTITVAASRVPGGYIFNSFDIPTNVNSNGCVRYGTSPGNYTYINCDILASSHSVGLTGLLPYTAYYFIVNSSRPNGLDVNSSEYMFVTDAVPDAVPPADISNLINVTYEPLYIRWTWTDPADADFDHVEVYIDGIFRNNVTKGVQFYNASYFRPNSTHTISIRSVDTSGNVNTTWNNRTATTPSVYTYVFEFLNTTGTVADESSAGNDSDGGASALLNESLIGGSDINVYNYVTGPSPATGTVTNFANMQIANDSAFATLTEGAGTLSPVYRWAFAADTESWVSNFTTTAGAVTMGFTGADGSPAGSVYSQLSNAGVATATTATTTWSSPNFTWINGTPPSARLDFDWKVTTFFQANPGSFYVLLVKPSGTTAQIYPTTSFSSTAGWSTLSNATVSAADFSQPGNYSLKLIAVLNTKANKNGLVEVGWDNPNITLGYTFYRMNITMETASVPASTNYYLEINYSRDANEAGYDAYAFNGTAWNYKGSLTSNAWTVFNTSLSTAEYNAGNPRIRYIDRTPEGYAQGNLFIDYQRIHGHTPAPPAAYRLDITANTTDIPEASTYVLQLRYNVSGENFTLQLWNGSAWNNRTTLNDTVMSYRNITLQADELISTGTLTGEAGNITLGYALVRYIDMTAGAAQQGRLYLDYQRVYSS